MRMVSMEDLGDEDSRRIFLGGRQQLSMDPLRADDEGTSWSRFRSVMTRLVVMSSKRPARKSELGRSGMLAGVA